MHAGAHIINNYCTLVNRISPLLKSPSFIILSLVGQASPNTRIKMEEEKERNELTSNTDSISDGLPTEKTPAQNMDIPQNKQETRNMETHAHELHKAPGHGWMHYIYEFLMLFLAVFCGFLAENQREQMVEHKKEKEYLSSLVGDLKFDTAQFGIKITQFEEKFPYFDSLFAFLDNPAIFHNELPFRFWKEIELTSSTYIPAEPTLQQLKYSGNFRLLANHQVLDSILVYESHINGGYINQTGYVLDFYKRQLQTREKYFDNSNFNRYLNDTFKGKLSSSDNYGLRLLVSDPVQLKELYNQYAIIKATNLYYINQLKSRHDEAEHLLGLIQREYRL